MNTVSMVITTHGRGSLLENSLARFGSGDAPGLTMPEQIIVVDDGSPDADVLGAVQIAAQWGVPCEYVRINNPGETNCCRARNVGLRVTLEDEILVCEPELIFLTDVVAQLLDARREFPQGILYGGTWHADDESTQGFEERCTWIAQFPYYWMAKCGWLYEVGGWDEALPGPWGWDDMDLYTRLRQLGHDTQLIEGVEGYHQWHPSRIEPAVENEAYVRAKQYPRDIVANKGVSWGRR